MPGLRVLFVALYLFECFTQYRTNKTQREAKLAGEREERASGKPLNGVPTFY